MSYILSSIIKLMRKDGMNNCIPMRDNLLITREMILLMTTPMMKMIIVLMMMTVILKLVND